MSYELPESFYRPERRRSLNLRQLRIWSILMVLFALWNLLAPWSLIRRNRLSAEFPNSEFGIQRAYISELHELVIERRGYVDRQAKYTYAMDGNLRKSQEAEVFTGIQLDSWPRLGSKYRTSGVIVDISPGTLTLQRMRYNSRRLRRESDPGHNPDTRVPVFRDDHQADVRSLKELPADGVLVPDLSISFETSNGPLTVSVLPGHAYWPFKDTHCYVDPYLYITTDSLRYIHRIRLTPGQDDLHTAVVEATHPITLELDRGVDSWIGHDPDRPELMLVNADGQRTVFDDSTLDILASTALAGNWEREYAALFQTTGFYSTDIGIPLTRVQTFRVYRLLALMLLAGLILLVLGYLPGDATRNEEPATSDDDPLAAAEARFKADLFR